ncbi:MAG: SAM-dependent chlorinase/fluorinase [Gemmatimonadetes bacterium]|nr:SAM-dependent chlorinase/fluorinase [Gemmatimonadota bacterium]
MSRVTLLTDFGTRDGYVAAMKGVIASIAPGVPIDDVSHDIPPGDIPSAAWALSRYWSRYPAGTVHLVVVDPGVGTERRALGALLDGRLLVAPDNGVATLALERASRWTAVSVQNENYVGPDRSATFHGRDIFAPAVAHLARGVPLGELGPPLAEPARYAFPAVIRQGGEARGEVVAIDRFGNAVTNVPGDWLGREARVHVGRAVLEVRGTYGEAASGEALALVNSDGLVEITVRDGAAAERLRIRRGSRIRVRGLRRGPENGL